MCSLTINQFTVICNKKSLVFLHVIINVRIVIVKVIDVRIVIVDVRIVIVGR